MLIDGIINPGLMHLRKKGNCAPVYRKGILFPIFWHFPPLNMPFQKDLKQEFSQLVTGEIASFF